MTDAPCVRLGPRQEKREAERAAVDARRVAEAAAEAADQEYAGSCTCYCKAESGRGACFNVGTTAVPVGSVHLSFCVLASPCPLPPLLFQQRWAREGRREMIDESITTFRRLASPLHSC